MADDKLQIEVEYIVNDAKLNQSLAKIQQNTGKALSGGSSSGGSQTMIDRSLTQATKLGDQLKKLQEAHSQLANQPGQERNLAKVNQELARVYGGYKNLSTNSNAYLSNLAKEVEYRKQSTVLMNQANQQAGIYSAHSQRQFAMLQQISGQVPGGGLVNKFISGAGSAEGGGGGLSGAMVGGGMAAAAGAAALAVGALVSKMGELASRSNELAQSASSASSSLGQLRSANERASIAKDAAASTPGVTALAGIQAYVSKQGSDFLSNLLNSQSQISSGVGEKIKAGLGGDSKESWRRTKEAGQDLNLDLARQRQGLDIQQNRANRDYALDVKQFNIESANQLFDLKKGQARAEQDWQIANTQFQEQFQEKQAAKSFALSQQYAQADYNLNKARQTQDFQISMGDRATDYKISRQDKAYDFGVSQSRNQTEFDVNRGRQGQDYQENLMKMALSGADGKSYLFASMDMRKQQQREQEDFNRQKQYAQADYSVSASRDARGFNLANQRDIRGFNIGQQREGQDLGINMQRAQQARDMQIDAEQYSRKYQGIQLEIQHNRNLEDASIALQRFTQSTGMQRQRLANQGADMAQDQVIQNRDFNISSYRALRSQGYNEQDAAGQFRKDDPLGAYGQSLTDPTFAAALARNAAATGQAPLADQVTSTIGLGGVANRKGIAGIGDNLGGFLGWSARYLGQGLGLLPPGLGGGDNTPGLRQLGSSQGGGAITFSPQHNVTFPTVGGASQADMQAMQQKMDAYMKALQDLDRAFGTTAMTLAGGSGPGFGSFSY